MCPAPHPLDQPPDQGQKVGEHLLTWCVDIMTGYGNSVPVQRGSGHLVAPGVAGHRRAGEQWSALGSKPQSDRVYVSQH